MELYKGPARLIVHGIECSLCDLIILEQGRRYLAVVRHYDSKNRPRGTETFTLARLVLKRQHNRMQRGRTVIRFFVPALFKEKTYTLLNDSERLHEALNK